MSRQDSSGPRRRGPEHLYGHPGSDRRVRTIHHPDERVDGSLLAKFSQNGDFNSTKLVSLISFLPLPE